MKLLYLYVKQSPKGLKYLGITSKKDPNKYRGSGKYWLNHLKKHNFGINDIKTTILVETYDKEMLVLFGLYYSKYFNVVESKEWANLKPESGESSLGYKHTPEAMEKMKRRNLGKKLSEETKRKISESNLGREVTEETRRKVGLANSRKTRSPELKLQISKALKGRKRTRESIEKQSKTNTGKKRKVSFKEYKIVYQYTLDDILVKEWGSAIDINKQLGYDINSIYVCCRGLRKTHKKYKWSYIKK